MIRRDLLKAEIEKLAQILAKVMSLKLEGKFDEANQLFATTINEAFFLTTDIVDDDNLSIFEKWLKETNLPAEKLDSLSEYLYYELGVSIERNKIIAPKLNLVYKVLADEHKIVHLVNFHRQEIIQQYL